MSGLLDLEAIKRDHPLLSVVGASVKLQRAGREWKACCPFHADRTPSFTIFAGGERFHCFGCGADGTVLDFVCKAHGVELREAAEMLCGGAIPAATFPLWGVSKGHDRGDDRRQQAVHLWRRAEPAAGTLVERYLRSRGLRLPIPPTIRFARLPYGGDGPLHPCLVACVLNLSEPSGPRRSIAGIQRTYLNAEGTGKAVLTKPKLSLGRISGGAIRCAPAATELIVTEGLEDGLTLQQELGGPAVWVAGGASMLPAMQFPPAVRSIVIGADGDAAGEAAARKAAEAFRARGLAVRIMRPAPGFKDFNEMLQERAA